MATWVLGRGHVPALSTLSLRMFCVSCELPFSSLSSKAFCLHITPRDPLEDMADSTSLASAAESSDPSAELSDLSGQQPHVEVVELWTLEICKCPPNTPSMDLLIPGEHILRCFECLRPYGRRRLVLLWKSFTLRALAERHKAAKDGGEALCHASSKRKRSLES